MQTEANTQTSNYVSNPILEVSSIDVNTSSQNAKSAKEVNLPNFLSGFSVAKGYPPFPEKVLTILRRPIPSKAITNGTRGLSSIKAIYISERLNEAFGEGRWYTKAETVERDTTPGKDAKPGTTVVQKVTLHLVDYPWFYAEAYGGNNNADLGDAYKGATTDALSKIAAVHLSVAVDVFKGNGAEVSVQFEQQEAKAAKAAQAEKKSQPVNTNQKAAEKPAQTPEEAKVFRIEETKKAQAIVADPPQCDDCLARNPDQPAPIKAYTVQTKNKKTGEVKSVVYDAADLVQKSQEKYQLNLCGDCQMTRAKNLKSQTSRVQ